jgi:hypothetical protein
VSRSLITRAVPVALLAIALAAPAAPARPSPRETAAKPGVCAVKAGSLRLSPARACRRARKAPKALPAARR